MSALRIQGVSKHFGEKRVLNEVSFEIQAGELAALAGANGAGKSTLLSLVAGLETFESGTIHIFDQNLEDYLDNPKYEIGFVSEGMNFPIRVSMRKMMSLQAQMSGRWDDAKAENIAKLLNLDLNLKWQDVSRGQKMQFAFILAICKNPDLLILDEITAVLDASARQIVVKEVREFARAGHAAILATNIISEVQNVCDRMVMLNGDGRALPSTPAEIREGYKKVVLFPKERMEKLNGVDHSVIRENSDGSLSVLLREGKGPADLREDKRIITPEEVFVFHTRKGA